MAPSPPTHGEERPTQTSTMLARAARAVSAAGGTAAAAQGVHARCMDLPFLFTGAVRHARALHVTAPAAAEVRGG